MKLDVSKGLNSKGSKFPFELSEKILYNDKSVQFDAPFSVKGEYSFNGNYISVKCNIVGEIKYNCDRCGDNQTKSVDLSVDERFFSEETADCDYVFTGGVIDLDDMVFHNVLLSLPMQLLCDEKCKGLCLGCYANLNYEDCKCK